MDKMNILTKEMVLGAIHQLLSIQPIWKQTEVAEQLSKLGYKLSARRIYVMLNKIVESYLSI